jgi:exopolysaccharide production protein ExoZ
LQRIPPYKMLDVFRGFAALWVVLVHCCDRWIAAGNSAHLHEPLYAFSMQGQLGVMLFFDISGYCIVAAAYGALVSGKSTGRYAFERLRRIYPPYLAGLILTVLSLVAISFASAHHLIPPVNHLWETQTDMRYWVGNVFLLQYELDTPFVNIVFWSLCYEVAFYLLVGVFLQGARWIKARRGMHAGTVFLVNAVGVTTVLALSELVIWAKPIFPFDMWHQFAIGGLLFFLLELKPGTMQGYSARFRWMLLGLVSVVTALTLAYVALRQVGSPHPSSKVRSMVALLFAALLIGLRKYDERVASWRVLRPLMWVGAFSYSLYLIHPVVLPYADILSRRAGLDGSLYWIAVWVQLAVAVVCGRVFYLVIERHFISKRQVQRLDAEHVA